MKGVLLSCHGSSCIRESDWAELSGTRREKVVLVEGIVAVRAQNPVAARPCGFDSLHQHHVFSLSYGGLHVGIRVGLNLSYPRFRPVS
jgi:hypothetical protein